MRARWGGGGAVTVLAVDADADHPDQFKVSSLTRVYRLRVSARRACVCRGRGADRAGADRKNVWAVLYVRVDRLATRLPRPRT